MNKKFLLSILLLVLLPFQAGHALEIPLQLTQGGWQILTYKNIKSNIVEQNQDGIKISVDHSASPLIYALDQPQTVKHIKVSGKMGDLPVIPAGLKQGDKGADDFAFRIGLVLEGDQTLNFAQMLIAPNWVKTLFDLAPKGTGIDHILFLNLANPSTLPWRSREHPSSKGLFKETIVQQINPNQAFELDHQLADSVRVLALWISADGDDTGSKFALTINDLSLN